MKRISILMLMILTLLAIRHDITKGSLAISEDVLAITNEVTQERLFFEKKVSPGNTLISIMEQHTNHSLSVPISEVIVDFQQLNNGVKPEHMQIGKVYKFPIYDQE